MTVRGGLMLVLATGTVWWICGCTQSAPLPTSSPDPCAATIAAATDSTNRIVCHPSAQARAVTSANRVSSSDAIRVAYRDTANPWKPSVKSRKWKHIVLHHTAADRGSVEGIHEAHLRRRDGNGNPWMGIGYHFVIGNGRGMPDGAIETTFRWRQQLHGAHAGRADYNQVGIGICLVGNFEKHAPTTAQQAAIRRLIRHLRSTYNIQPDKIVRHSALKKTACPGRHFSIAKVTQGSPVPLFGDFRSQESTGVTLAAQEQTPQ